MPKYKMKTLSLILLVFSVGFLSAAPPTTDLTSISPTSGAIGAINIAFTFGNPVTLVKDDTITFSLSTGALTGSETSKAVLAATPTGGATSSLSVTFATAGVYTVFLTNTGGTTPTTLKMTINPSSTDITSTIPPTANTNKQASFTFTLGSTNAITVGDILTWAATIDKISSAAATEQYKVVAPIGATIVTPLTMTAPGTYNLFLTRNGATAQQTGISLSVTTLAPLATLITAVTPVTATVGTAVSLTFTLTSASSLTTDESIVLSTATTPLATDPTILISQAPSTATYSGSVTFKTAGTYSVFVDNGIQTPQTGLSIVVATSSTFVKMSLALGALLFLF